MAERKFYERISAASVMPPKDASQDWLANAERDGVRLLTREENDFVILYASFQALLIIAVFGEAFAPIGEVDMKSPPGPVRASRTDRRSDRSGP